MNRRGIILYLEYQSVCLFVRIGSPAPSPPSDCFPPWNQRGGGGNTRLRLRGRGGGANSDDWKESLAPQSVVAQTLQQYSSSEWSQTVVDSCSNPVLIKKICTFLFMNPLSCWVDTEAVPVQCLQSEQYFVPSCHVPAVCSKSSTDVPIQCLNCEHLSCLLAMYPVSTGSSTAVPKSAYIYRVNISLAS